MVLRYIELRSEAVRDRGWQNYRLKGLFDPSRSGGCARAFRFTLPCLPRRVTPDKSEIYPKNQVSMGYLSVKLRQLWLSRRQLTRQQERRISVYLVYVTVYLFLQSSPSMSRTESYANPPDFNSIIFREREKKAPYSYI